jgi:hypothetical protein
MTEELVQAITHQRNAALDGLAVANAQLIKLGAQMEALKKELEEARKPASQS